MLSVEEIGRFMSDDESSERKRLARLGQRYYEGIHDIRNYKLYYYNADGDLVEDKTRSNIKISHAFFTELVDQCVQYMLSGDEPIVRSDVPGLQDKLNEYFGDDFISELAETLTDTCAGGFGYMYGYMSDNFKTKFEFAEANGVIEVRAKDTDDHTEYVIYWYVDRIDKGRKVIKRIQVWDRNQTYYYVRVDNGQIALDESEPINPRPHVLYDEDGETYYKGLGYIPFFRLDANRKQQSHLKPIKGLIDDYDLMACGLSNNIQDMREAVWVVKGFAGDSVEELIHNTKTKKHIAIGEEGDVDIKTIDIPYEARSIKLELDEKNIYKFGMGFNSAQVGDGNVTNIVIKSRYALLDMKCNKLEKRLKAFMTQLVRIVLDEINANENTGYTLADIDIVFEREIMTNSTDNAQIALTEAQTKQTEVATLLNVANSLGNDAVLEALCAVLDLDYEEVKELALEADNGGLDNATAALNNAGNPINTEAS